jgi:hypothetical protein
VAEDYFARAEREIALKLRPLEANALIKQFEIYLSAPENFLFRPAVLHADRSRDHILVENDSVTAVIDFGDVNWGDPDYDFMYLFVEFGQAFAEEVARRYGHRDLERLISKLLFFLPGGSDRHDPGWQGPGAQRPGGFGTPRHGMMIAE